MTRRLEDHAAVDDAEFVIHADPHPFQQGGEMPGINQLGIGGGLTADRLEPGAMEKSRQQWMAGMTRAATAPNIITDNERYRLGGTLRKVEVLQ